MSETAQIKHWGNGMFAGCKSTMTTLFNV